MFGTFVRRLSLVTSLAFRCRACEMNKAKRTSDLISLDTMLQEHPREDIVKILNILILQLD